MCFFCPLVITVFACLPWFCMLVVSVLLSLTMYLNYHVKDSDLTQYIHKNWKYELISEQLARNLSNITSWLNSGCSPKFNLSMGPITPSYPIFPPFLVFRTLLIWHFTVELRWLESSCKLFTLNERKDLTRSSKSCFVTPFWLFDSLEKIRFTFETCSLFPWLIPVHLCNMSRWYLDFFISVLYPYRLSLRHTLCLIILVTLLHQLFSLRPGDFFSYTYHWVV